MCPKPWYALRLRLRLGKGITRSGLKFLSCTIHGGIFRPQMWKAHLTLAFPNIPKLLSELVPKKSMIQSVTTKSTNSAWKSELQPRAGRKVITDVGGNAPQRQTLHANTWRKCWDLRFATWFQSANSINSIMFQNFLYRAEVSWCINCLYTDICVTYHIIV